MLYELLESRSVLRVIHETGLDEVLGGLVSNVGEDDLLVAGLDEFTELVEDVSCFLEGDDL